MRIRSLVAACSISVVASALSAQAAPPLRGFPRELDDYITRAVKDWGLPGLAIAVVRNDTVLVAKGYGVRELGKPERVDEHTVFDAASLTKSFTATAIAMLVDEGKMRLDEPVRRYVPEIEFADPYLTTHVTIRDLLAHRTGLQAANFMWRFTGYDRTEALRRARYLKSDIPFRTGMVYSNLGYTIAGEASARAAGSSWDALVRGRILDPLAMRDTYLWAERDRRADNLASPHAVIGGVQQPIDPRDGVQGRDGRIATAPAGAVQSSASDLATWMRFHLGDGTHDGRRLVSPEALEEMHSPQVLVPTPPAFRRARQLDFFATYGMGWQVWDYRGHPMLWHSGSGNGQIAYMAILPRDRLGVVVLVNSWRAPTIHGTLASRILDTYLGYPLRDVSAAALSADSAAQQRGHEAMTRFEATRAPNASPSRPIAEYAGLYRDTLYGDITIRREGDSLTLQMGRGEIADVLPWNRDTLLVRWRTPLFREDFTTRAHFTLDSLGRPRGFMMRLNRDTVRAAQIPVSNAAPPSAAPLVLEDVTLIDGIGSGPIKNRTIVIRDGRIAEIHGSGSKPPPTGAEVRRLSGRYVIPGLIDAHVHVTAPFERPGQQDTILSFMFRGGVTTVRDMAGDAIKLQALERAAESAMKPWPRIVYSALFAGDAHLRSDRRVPSIAGGMAIGGAPWLRPVTPGMDFARDVALAKSTGATGIKVYAELTATDLARLAAEAHRQGLRVWSHAAVIPARPSDAVKAGVDVLSHAYLLVFEGIDSMPRLYRESLPFHRFDLVAPDSPAIDALLRLMKARGTMLEPTLYVNGGVAARALRDTAYASFLGMDTWSFEVTRRAYRAGVLLVVGTDLMGRPARDSLPLVHDEMELLVSRVGLTPLDALVAATRTNARALGIARDYGVVRPGMVADLVVLEADPTADIRNTRSVVLTIKGGVVHSR